MRATRVATIVGAIVATAGLINVASAGTDPVKAPEIRAAKPLKFNLSTRHGVQKYLRSLGVDPRTFVVQRGKRNYAGPRCPGKRWNCTRSKRVFQISPGTNTVECTGVPNPTNTPTAQTCVIVQTGTTNTARCVEKSTSPVMKQECTITQTGAENRAYVIQLIDTSATATPTNSTTPTQDSVQEAEVNQNGGDNFVDGSQDIKQSITGNTTDQHAHQSFVVCQDGPDAACTASLATGANDAKIQQAIMSTAYSKGGVVSQRQNSAGLFTPFNGVLTDCNPGVGTVSEPEICANVIQNSAVSNRDNLHQDSHFLEHASGTTESGEQDQGGSGGGLDAQVLQNGAPTNDVHQHLKWDQSAPEGVFQDQDPNEFCCSKQTGSGGGGTNLHQLGHLHSTNEGDQFLQLTGDCFSTVRCLILQSGKIDGAQASARCEERAEDENPAVCLAETTCTAAQDEDDEYVVPATCIAFPPKGNPPDAELTALGFDASDFAHVINFEFPLPTVGLEAPTGTGP